MRHETRVKLTLISPELKTQGFYASSYKKMYLYPVGVL